ncbi:MAG: hypothetical protein J5I47_11075 [Vicingus serpentipes]|nr:hypothetical protein [Vicingus serpentipes]
MKECKVICTTIKDYSAWLPHWSGWNISDTYLLIDNSKIEDDDEFLKFLHYVKNIGEFNVLAYSEKALRVKLNFWGEVSKNHYWNPYGNRNIIWFYPHFRMIYALEHIDADYYWFFDDDVQCSDWHKFFSKFDYDDDFISYYLFKDLNVESNPHIPKVNSEMTSFHDENYHWLKRFPGDGDILPSMITDLYGSFYPVIRHSRESLLILKDYLSKGYYGYSEGFVPTVLANEGFRINTIFRDSDESILDEVKLTHKHIKIDWKWL